MGDRTLILLFRVEVKAIVWAVGGCVRRFWLVCYMKSNQICSWEKQPNMFYPFKKRSILTLRYNIYVKLCSYFIFPCTVFWQQLFLENEVRLDFSP